MNIDKITTEEANALVEGAHYLGATKYRPRFCLATSARDAVAIFGYPNAASFKIQFDALELVRLWRRDGAVVRTDHFLHRACRRAHELAPECEVIVTYADPAAGHTGQTYKGAGFHFVGKSRATDQWETPEGVLGAAQVYRLLKTKSRARIAAARPDWRLLAGVPKLLFVFPMAAKISDILERLGRQLPEARRHLFSRGHGGFRVSIYQERFPPSKCAHCGRSFLARRSDARTCSGSCRTMLSRRRG